MTAKPKSYSIYDFMSHEMMYSPDKKTVWKSRVYGTWIASQFSRDRSFKSFEEAIHYATTGELP